MGGQSEAERRELMFKKILIANRGPVIASEAKQSSVGLTFLDCRVATLLAMTTGETVADV